MPGYPKKAAYHTFVRDAETGAWKQVEVKDIPPEKRLEFWDHFALGAGLQRVEKE